MSTDHDYTQDDAPAGAAATDFDDYSFLPAPVATRDADAIEQSGSFRDLGPGDHELVVVGLYKPPEEKMRTGTLRGQATSWVVMAIGVKLASAADPTASILDFFDLPPADPAGMEAYLGATSQGGARPGFQAEKFAHFISRLGWPVVAGVPLPAEACNIKNWRGRYIHATVRAKRDRPDKNEVAMFSYRASARTVRGTAASPAGQGARPVVRPAAQLAPPARPTSPAQASPAAATGVFDL